MTQLPLEIERRVARAALMAGARIIAARIKAAAPVDSGFLRRHVRARMATALEVAKLAGFRRKAALNFSRLPGTRAIQIALAGVSKDAYWARFISYGWTLTGHKPDKRKIKQIAGTNFISIAVEGARAQANAVMKKTLADGIAEAARNLSGSYSTSGFSKRGRTFIR